jgi:hypothetical protein
LSRRAHARDAVAETADAPSALAPAASLHAAGRTLAARAALPDAEALTLLGEAERALAEEIRSVAAIAEAALAELHVDAEGGWEVALDGTSSALRALYKHTSGSLIHSFKLEVRRSPAAAAELPLRRTACAADHMPPSGDGAGLHASRAERGERV